MSKEEQAAMMEGMTQEELVNLITSQQNNEQQRQMLDGEKIKGEMPTGNEEYNKHFMNSLGAESLEEAMMIAQAAGIQPDDIPEFMASQGMFLPQQPGGAGGAPVELTRRQQLGIDPMPPQQASMENMFDPEMVLANGGAQDIESGMKPSLLPPGMSPEEFAQLAPEQQQMIHRQLLAQ